MIESGQFPDNFTQDEKNEILALYENGKIRQAQKMVIDLMNPKPKRTLL